MQRRVAINLVFFLAVFGVMLYWAADNIVTIDRIERPYTITGDFAQASGVRANAEVTYLGVHYGRVTDVQRRERGVRVTMKVDRGKDIPEDSIARIFRKSAIGEPYIDFVPGPDATSDGPVLEAGDNVPQDRTTVPLEFSELLRSASALVGSIDAESAGSLVHELAVGLDGRGQDLRDLTTSFDAITSTLASRTDELDRLADNSTRVVGVLADHRLSVGRSLANLRAVTESLRDAKGDLEALFRDGPGFLTTTADLVADQKANLDCLLSDLAPVLRVAASAEHRRDLAVLLEQGPVGFGYVFNAVDREADGPWIRVNLAIPVGGTEPALYVPRASLPVVPSISPCVSDLKPASVFPADAPDPPPTRDGSLSDTLAAGSVGGSATFAPQTAEEILRHPAAGTTAAAPLAAILALSALAGAVTLLGLRRTLR